MKKILYLISILMLAMTFSCKKSLDNFENQSPDALKAAPDGFNYSTSKTINLNIRLITPSEKPLKGVLVSIYNPSNIKAGSELTKVISDNNGYIKTAIKVPGFVDTLVVDPAYFGLLRNVKLYSKNNTISAIIGGSSGVAGNVVIEKKSNVRSLRNLKLSSTKTVLNGPGSTVYSFDPSNYDALGRPIGSLLYPKDNIDWDKLIANINTSLPERSYVKSKYISTEAPANLKITQLSDVWITFVHEGADYRNSFGYYTYPTGNPPKTENDIDTIHLVFPNASLKGHVGEGNMLMGDKVKIGRFTQGTSIGFVLLQNAYQGPSFNTSATKFYSNEALNPEDESLKRHNVLLNNVSQKSFIIGFEDIDRRPGNNSDQDFNDLVVYAQSNPVEAISPVDIPYLEEGTKDSDNDGVPDDQDAYPDDKNRAYNRYYPSESIWGTVAFEDLWPKEGDYDLNDLVVSYRYKFAMSSSNEVVDLTGEFLPLAAGATMQNGFGIQLPISPSSISGVSGYNLSAGYIKLSSNGTESGQSKAVVIPFDNYRNLFGGASGFINTMKGLSLATSQQVTVSINFVTPLSDDFTTKAPFNPFMISDLTRGNEVHLANQEPTSLANTALLGTGQDDSKPSEGKYYLTPENRPFALDFYGPFYYPVEKSSITSAYQHFAEWAASGGNSFKNWYDISQKGYASESLIYIR